IRFAPHIPDVRHCLYFEAMDREVPEGTVLKVGRFTDRVSQQPNRIAFKSKVVSRSHAEIWSENGHFYIRDTKSSSGTFLNHIRLSVASAESLPKRLHDGDILQLGVDYQGGIQDIYKCVKIRLEINRAWQRQAENPYRMRVMKNLQNMFNSFNTGAEERHECCICLYAMGPFQALFVAPCSHCFHFKCIKPIIFTNTGFSCPLCRTFADLEAPVE
ncbi:SMAD/FHA domain-containing protein, partial [Dimargaris cristalligena]